MKTDSNHKDDHGQAGVIDFHKYRRKKAEEEFLTRGRKPLYVSHSRGQVKGQDSSQDENKANLSDFSERIASIRHSLEKINALMTDLKKLSSGKNKSPLQ